MEEASTQNFLEIPDLDNMHLTLFKIVLFILSTMPFCWKGVHASSVPHDPYLNAIVSEFTTIKFKPIIISKVLNPFFSLILYKSFPFLKLIKSFTFFVSRSKPRLFSSNHPHKKQNIEHQRVNLVPLVSPINLNGC